MYTIINEIMKEIDRRIPTPKLNRFSKILDNALPTYKGKRVKLYYMTQIGTRPPSFALFVNIKEGIKAQHERMIERVIREDYPYVGTPIRLFIRRRRKKK